MTSTDAVLRPIFDIDMCTKFFYLYLLLACLFVVGEFFPKRLIRSSCLLLFFVWRLENEIRLSFTFTSLCLLSMMQLLLNSFSPCKSRAFFSPPMPLVVPHSSQVTAPDTSPNLWKDLAAFIIRRTDRRDETGLLGPATTLNQPRCWESDPTKKASDIVIDINSTSNGYVRTKRRRRRRVWTEAIAFVSFRFFREQKIDDVPEDDWTRRSRLLSYRF
jgi:hypothetical protein